ncbi:MAG: DUF3617 domain-containing protein [Lysobacteraceae bacterium]|nr:MAG: DUF3617 domain-containing protein [Xanthomonadaceae bacterium]
MHIRFLLVTALALGTGVGAASAQQLQPGLWDINSTMKSSNGDMQRAMAQAQAQMATLPPEQRKMMEDMMNKQGIGMSPGGGTSVRLCMTRDMVERDSIPTQQGNCKSTQSPRAGNTIKVNFSCTSPASSGDGTVTFLSPTAYTSKMNIRSTQGGKTETLAVDSSGKWVSADCGAIKPVGAPASK